MAQSQVAAPVRPRPLWQVPLLVGFCCGIGYGLTHRLLTLQLSPAVQLVQRFEVRPFPGTSLESLRLRFGADNQDIRGDLDLLEIEKNAGNNQPANKPAARPDPKPETVMRGTDPEPDLRDADGDAGAQPEPLQLPSADLPQLTPDAGQR